MQIVTLFRADFPWKGIYFEFCGNAAGKHRKRKNSMHRALPLHAVFRIYCQETGFQKIATTAPL